MPPRVDKLRLVFVDGNLAADGDLYSRADAGAKVAAVKPSDGDGGRAVVERADKGRPVAEAAAHLLVDGDRTRIRQCHADDCRWWFEDTSKNGRRKWCSMARCGNRAKVAAHYKRHRED